MSLDDEKIALIFKALCDAHRISIIRKLQSGEKCACVLLEDLNLSQSNLSYHMKILLQSEIVVARHQGKWIYYRISEKGSAVAKQVLVDILKFSEQSNCNCCL